MATKPENINTLTILLELDKEARKDLAALKPATLELITQNYIENARKTNHKMVDEHVNTNLPVVGVNILVFHEGEYTPCKRERFITSRQTELEFKRPDGSSFVLPKANIKWKVV
jgi:hypothetical protein